MASEISDQDAEPQDYMTMVIPENETHNDSVSLAQEKRPTTNEALSKSILTDRSSVGLKIMQKMGFDVTKGLGKDKSGSAEPIKVDLKRNRVGIGASKPVKKVRSDSIEHVDPGEYRDRQSSKNEERLWRGRVRQAQNTLMELENFDFLDYKGSWLDVNPLYQGRVKENQELNSDVPSTIDPNELSDESENEVVVDTDKELFAKLNNELRSRFSYCFWCGSFFGDNYDYDCPGVNESDHD